MHIHIQSNTNTDGLRRSGTNGLLASDFGSSTRRERHNSYYANHPQRAAHRVMFKISADRDPKTPSTSSTVENNPLCPNGRELNCLPAWSNLNPKLTVFQNPQILRTISSEHDVIHTPAPFPVWGFIVTMVMVISFARERKTVPNDYASNS